MRLNDEESAMLAGRAGPARQWAIDHQIRVGRYLGAADFVPVSQAHIMADTEIARRRRRRMAGTPGGAAEHNAACASPPSPIRAARTSRLRRGCGTRSGCWRSGASRYRGLRGTRRADDRHLHQLPDDHAGGVRRTHGVWRHRCGDLLEQRARCAIQFRGRTVGAGRRSDRAHAALRLSLAGKRRATLLLRVDHTPRELHDWGALGGIVGRIAGDYWQVPALLGIDRVRRRMS